MPTGTEALPWWVDALLALVILVIVITLIVLVTEIVRNIVGGRGGEPRPTDGSQPAVPAVNGGDQV